VGYAYKHDAEAHTFSMDNFTDVTLRGYNRGGLAPHDLADPADRPYKKFEYASANCTNISGNEISVNGSGDIQWGSASSYQSMMAAWTKSLEKNDICGKYYQDKTNQSDKGEWRVPSACEMALMWIENIMQTTGGYALSASHDYFITYDLRNETEFNQGFMGYNNYYNRRVMALDIVSGGNSGSGNVRIRCVRDVKQ
jgi:hypothetical protein